MGRLHLMYQRRRTIMTRKMMHLLQTFARALQNLFQMVPMRKIACTEEDLDEIAIICLRFHTHTVKRFTSKKNSLIHLP